MNAFGIDSRIRIAAAVAAVALLAGCASGGASMTRGDGYKRNDAAYMYAVENVAKRRGVRVMWVNPPQEMVKRQTSQLR